MSNIEKIISLGFTVRSFKAAVYDYVALFDSFNIEKFIELVKRIIKYFSYISIPTLLEKAVFNQKRKEASMNNYHENRENQNKAPPKGGNIHNK